MEWRPVVMRWTSANAVAYDDDDNDDKQQRETQCFKFWPDTRLSSVSLITCSSQPLNRAARDAPYRQMTDDNIPSHKYRDTGIPRYLVTPSINSLNIARIARRTKS